MSEAVAQIIVAIIGGGLTLAGVIVTNHAANKKMAEHVKRLEENQKKSHESDEKMSKQVETLTGEVTKLNGEVTKLKEHQEKNYLGILRLEIMSDEMPIHERIIAGQEYIDHGGNGEVKKFYLNFIKEHTK